jgi:hypothetical protein
VSQSDAWPSPTTPSGWLTLRSHVQLCAGLKKKGLTLGQALEEPIREGLPLPSIPPALTFVFTFMTGSPVLALMWWGVPRF